MGVESNGVEGDLGVEEAGIIQKAPEAPGTRFRFLKVLLGSFSAGKAGNDVKFNRTQTKPTKPRIPLLYIIPAYFVGVK